MRARVRALVVVAGSVSLGHAAWAETKCDLAGPTVLVQRLTGVAAMRKNPLPTGGLGGQVDPWKVNRATALPDPTLYIDEGDWEVGATGDVNGDGICDAVWVRWAFGASGVLEMRELSLGLTPDLGAPYTFGGPTEVGTQRFLPPPDQGWTLVGSGDFDGDRHADLVFWNEPRRVVEIWSADSQGFPGRSFSLPGAAAPWRAALVADLDGSGPPEILWRDEDTGHVLSWKVRPAQGGLELAEEGLLEPAGPIDVNWRPRAAEDFDGDGYQDLLFQNVDSERVVIWFMKDRQRVGGTFVSPSRLAPADTPVVADVCWKIVAPR